MSYTVRHQRRDGTVERKRVTVQGGAKAETFVRKHHADKMKELHDKSGWNKDRSHRLKASIPQVVWEEVALNDGPEAARDNDYLIRRAEELGFTVKTRSRRR